MNHTIVALAPSLAHLVTPMTKAYAYYNYFDSFSDPKLRGWLLMGSPIWPLAIVTLYLTIVYHGQNWLKNPESPPAVIRFLSSGKSGGKHHHHHHHHHHRQRNAKDIPFGQRPFISVLLFIYNLWMASLNAWIAYELFYCASKSNYNFLCQLVYTGKDDPYETRIAHAIWWYFASKGIELLDTIFIIIKKKSNQLTFLHIYHHSTMFLVWWVGAKFVPGGSAVTGALVNCIVHVLMYSYYALASLGPRIQPYLWWKKYLTIIQLIQFSLGVTLGLNSIITGCPFTRWMQYVFVCYAFSFLILFGNFYRHTYNNNDSGSSISKRQKSSKSIKPNESETEPMTIINNKKQSVSSSTSTTETKKIPGRKSIRNRNKHHHHHHHHRSGQAASKS